MLSKPLRSSRRADRDSRRLRLLPAREGSCLSTPQSRVSLTSTRAAPGQRVAGWRLNLVSGHRRSSRSGSLLVQKLDERGELEAYVARNDAWRPHIGQATILFASRE